MGFLFQKEKYMSKAFCNIEWSDGVWLIAAKCPHCHGIHGHGGGDDINSPMLGHRVADCGADEGYELVLENVNAN